MMSSIAIEDRVSTSDSGLNLMVCSKGTDLEQSGTTCFRVVPYTECRHSLVVKWATTATRRDSSYGFSTGTLCDIQVLMAFITRPSNAAAAQRIRIIRMGITHR